MKKLLNFILIIVMFLLVCSFDTIEPTTQANITSAKKQAQINKISKQ